MLVLVLLLVFVLRFVFGLGLGFVFLFDKTNTKTDISRLGCRYFINQMPNGFPCRIYSVIQTLDILLDIRKAKNNRLFFLVFTLLFINNYILFLN